jgi:BlaI family penicillinase repressor
MKRAPRISEGQWEVMEVLWRKSPLTAQEVVHALRHQVKWKAPTVRTMLGRLVRRKALAYTAQGKVFFYRPLVTRDECLEGVSKPFLQRVMEGASVSLVLHFVKSKKLSRAELAELEAIVRTKKKESI